MSGWIALSDGVAVSLFGSALAASFCQALDTRRKRWLFWGAMAGLLLLQGGICFLWNAEVLRRLYPLIAHLPLMLLLCAMTGRLLWPVVSVFYAYLCCQLRRWIALLAAALLGGGAMMRDIVQLVLTVPLLLLLLRFVVPAVQRPARESIRLQWQFGVIPALYYAFDYITVIYTDLLISGNSVAVEFMPFVCCAAYLAFLLYHSDQEERKLRFQKEQELLELRIRQSEQEIHALRESQAMARQYRHDLRHHLQYLAACLENGQEPQAKRYIADICREIEAQKVTHYCENEAANLILSAFADRARKKGVPMKIRCGLSPSVRVSDRDLCVLLSNALENALQACQPLTDGGATGPVEVTGYEREGKVFLQVINPCGGEVRFEKGIPVSDQPDHGIGVQSICAIVKRYGGLYSFLIEDGRFILRLSL